MGFNLDVLYVLEGAKLIIVETWGILNDMFGNGIVGTCSVIFLGGHFHPCPVTPVSPHLT